MPEAYMRVKIIEGPNKASGGELNKRGDVPGKDQRKWISLAVKL